jgi:hypothetical protein
MINIIITVLLPIYGAFMSRFHGGGFKGGVNKSLKNMLWALPFGVIVWLCGGAWWLCAITVALCAIGKAVAHGRGLGSDEPMRDDMKPEKVEYAILWLQDKVSTRTYKHLIMSLTGFAAVSGAVVAFMFINPMASLIIALGGLLKGVAYEIGTFILPNQTKSGIKNLMYKTEIGEFITGLFAYGGLAIAFIIT